MPGPGYSTKKHDVTLQLENGPPNIALDSDRKVLRQIIHNLISNACKYNRPGGTAQIQVAVTANRNLEIRVRDTGPGIPPEKQSRVFAPFDRLGAEHSNVGGTGIGLALTLELARQLGGSLDFESEVGVGTVFVLKLSPYVETDAAADARSKAGSDPVPVLPAGKTANRYRLTEKMNPAVRADFSGFTCRWKDIDSPHGETISLILKVRDGSLPPQELNQLYKDILAKVQDSFGDEHRHHPLNEEQLEVTSSVDFLKHEAGALSGRSSGIRYRLALIKITVESWIMRMAIAFQLGFNAYWYDLSRLKDYQIRSSDFQKFDGALKMVLSCSKAARLEFTEYLERLFRAGKIYYGLHISDRALMTCVLHEGSRREVHFVDAADGGYANAARKLKMQMRGD